MRLLFLLFLIFVGCAPGKSEPKDPVADERLVDLQAKQAKKIDEYKKGWPSETDCDGLLFAGQACAAGMDLDIHRAELEPGIWHRRPEKACHTEQDGDVGSKSSISNDMVLGLYVCLYARGDYESLKRFADVSEKNKWLIGIPKERVQEVLLKPNQVGYLGRMLLDLSDGKDRRGYAKLFAAYLPVTEDYQRHLLALGVYLNGLIAENLEAKGLKPYSDKDQVVSTISGLKDHAVEALDKLIEAEPNNYFFHAVRGIYSGDMAPAITLLLSDETPRPTYVRGDRADRFELAHWLFTTDIVLGRFGK